MKTLVVVHIGNGVEVFDETVRNPNFSVGNAKTLSDEKWIWRFVLNFGSFF